MRKPTIFTTLAALVLTGASLQGTVATSSPETPQASIPFANTASSIRDWQADDIQGIWVQDAFRRWYYAKLMAPCLGLDFATRVGFQTSGGDTLDKFSSVIVPGHGNCPIASFPTGNTNSGSSNVNSRSSQFEQFEISSGAGTRSPPSGRLPGKQRHTAAK